MASVEVKPEASEVPVSSAPIAHAAPPAASSEQPKLRYKSYRKKYRKMHIHFTHAMEDAQGLHAAEHKATEVARRIKEENDKLLELLLSVNQSANVHPKYRFNLDSPTQRPSSSLPPIPNEDAYPLPAPAKSLEALKSVTVHTTPQLGSEAWPDELRESVNLHPVRTHRDARANAQDSKLSLPGYMTLEHEEQYLATLDKALSHVAAQLPIPSESDAKPSTEPDVKPESKAELKRARELSLADFALQYPQSAQNWLRAHAQHHHRDRERDRDEEGSQRGRSPPLSKKKKAAAVKKEEQQQQQQQRTEPPDPLDEEIGVDPEPQPKGKRKRLADGEDAYRPKGGSGGKKRKRASDAAIGDAGAKKKKGAYGDGGDD